MKFVFSMLAALACGGLFASTIQLTADTEITDGGISAETAYDLSGFTLTLTEPFVITDGATLTISDSVGGGAVDYPGRKGYAIRVVDGTLVLDSGTIKSASGSGAICLAASTSAPKFQMNGGKVVASSIGTEAAAVLAGLYSTDNAQVEVTGGEISGLIGIALAGRNKLTVANAPKIDNLVGGSSEPAHWGVALSGGDRIRLTTDGNFLIGGEGALARDEKVDYVVGNGLKTGHYSSAPLAFAIANGYKAEKTNAVADYPWELKKDIEDVTVDVGGENVPVEVPKAYLEETILKEKPAATTEEIKEFLEEKDANGLANWQRAQLGLDVSAALAVSAIDGEGQTTANVVLSKVKTIESNGKLTISYTIHKGDKEGEALETRPEPSFTVDLSTLSKENPIEKWVVTANFKAETNENGQAISIIERVQSVNEVGAVRVENPAKSVLLATPWVRVKDDGTKDSLAVKDMVDPVTLKPGDELNVYNTDKTYSTFVLDENKEWKGVAKVVGGEAVTPDPSAPIKPGQAVWLNRMGDLTKPVYLLGQVEKQDATSISPEQGSTEAPVATILGNPHPEATIIPANDGAVGNVAKDEILVVEGKVFRRYVRNDQGDLGYYKTNERGKLEFIKVDEVTIPAGEAFWYQSKGGTVEIPVGAK